MEFNVKLIYVIIVLFRADLCSSQEIGRVYIGVQGSSPVNSYSFNRNAGRQQLAIYILIPDPANPSLNVALRDIVDISCIASNMDPGYSRVSFLPFTFNPGGPTAGNINFDLTASGRAVDIQCYGVSQGLTCPADTSGGGTQPQFCRSTSISDPVSLSVRPPPIVSFCSPVIIVPDDGQTESTFALTLSEPVKDIPVNVYCQVVSFGSLGLNIVTPPPAQNTSVDVSVRYIIISRGTPSEVLCVANSQSGNQYVNATSSGPTSRARFVLSTGVIQLIPMVTPAYSNMFKGLLALDAGAVTDEGISFQCAAEVVSDIAQAMILVNSPVCDFTTANATTTTPSPTTPPSTSISAVPVTTVDVNSSVDPNATTETTPPEITNPVPIDLTSPWILDEASFSFQRSQTYKMVTARRQREVLQPATELVVLTCCVMSSTPKYFNMSTAMLTSAHLQPYFCANCTGGPTSDTVTSERVIQNPSFREVAPCPCDLTYLVCDINCCCDQDCTSQQQQTFSYCLPGPFGGQGNGIPFRNCNSNHTFKDDWFPLMCVQFETNAYLGMFYGNTAAVQTETAYNVKLAAQPSFHSYRENEERFVDSNAGLVGYQDGFNVRTQRADIPSAAFPRQGILSLPERYAGGACLNIAPVRFLRDRSSTCVHTDIQAMCHQNSVLSAIMYAESTSQTHPPCPESYRILEQYGGTNVKIANTNVEYYCAVDDSSYIKSTATYSDTVLPTVSQTFPQEMYSENCSFPCTDPACLQYNENQVIMTSLPPRCSWDDGYTQPPIPAINLVYCNNTVVDVRYLFTWTGQSIVDLTATVILANVRMNVSGQPSSLVQDFDVRFQHQMSSQGNATDNYDNVQGGFARSGYPGYDYGKPLISGCSAGSGFVDRNTTQQMAVFEPGPDGLCFTASRRSLTFGEDILTSCKLRLSMDTINNCSSLRELMLNHLSVLMPSDVIGRQGNNDPFNASMWVNVIREIPQVNFTQNITEDNSTEFEEEVYQPIDNIMGICHNISSAINLVILYGEAGKANGYPIREVVGARVSFSVSDWRMSCSGPNAVRCQNNSQYVETFLLTSTVTFIKVPASVPEPVIAFYTSKDPSCATDSCARYYSDFDRSMCRHDTCWQELLYPLSASYGADPPMWTLAVSLVAVLFIIGYFMITRPWF